MQSSWTISLVLSTLICVSEHASLSHTYYISLCRVGVCVPVTETEPMPAFHKDPEKKSDILSICPTSLKEVPTSAVFY